MKFRAALILPCCAVLGLSGCFGRRDESGFAERIVPAEEYSRSIRDGTVGEYSMYKVNERRRVEQEMRERQRTGITNAALVDESGDPRYLDQGYALKRAVNIPSPQIDLVNDGGVGDPMAPGYVRQPPRPPLLPPGSRSPYPLGQMTANPSLWPDEAQGATYFTDFRAFQAMDVITIIVNESSEGKKKTKTDTESTYNLAAGIKEFFGLETKKFMSNNESLNPEELINAQTSTKYEGEGELNRKGELKARISAVILEVLPNGLLRIEGTKIVSVDNEEEVMVLSGLVRIRDIDSSNQVDSNRVANMRIDFYGRGVLAEKQGPGFLARLFDWVWPF